MTDIILQTTGPDDPAIADLIDHLDSYLNGLYPPSSNYALSIEELRLAKATFVTAHADGRVVGCGGFVKQDGRYAELKRMIVLAEYRGLSIGVCILAELESLIRAAGLDWAMLETGVAQPGAIGLFEKAGYVRRGPFGDYPNDPLSVFMEKRLA
jgi:putative acetyltransferase